EDATVERMLAHYRAVLARVADRPDTRIDELLDPVARQGTTPPHHRARPAIERGVWEHFTAVAAEHADRPAIIAGDRTWTYRELAARAEAFAARLSIEDTTRVGLVFAHGGEMVAAM